MRIQDDGELAGIPSDRPPAGGSTGGDLAATAEIHPLGPDVVRVIRRLLDSMGRNPSGGCAHEQKAAATIRQITGQAGEGKAKPVATPVAKKLAGQHVEVATEASGTAKRRTTVILQGLPPQCTRDMLLEILEEQGLRKHVDFLYVPCNFEMQRPFGYAFVNFTSPTKAAECWLRLDGFKDWGGASTEHSCEVKWALLQGLDAYVQRYSCSPVLHHSVPNELKPIVLSPDGSWAVLTPPPYFVRVPRRTGRIPR